LSHSSSGFSSDTVENSSVDFAYSNRNAKITDKEAGLDLIGVFPDLVPYWLSLTASRYHIAVCPVDLLRNLHI
jgi:hypothetical protein